MRKASQKIELSFYEGMRIGISNAINSFYMQNGFSHETFNMAASMRKEYIRIKNKEDFLRNKLLGVNNGNCE